MAQGLLGVALAMGTAFWAWAIGRAEGHRRGALAAAAILGWGALTAGLAAAGAFPVSDEAPSPALGALLLANAAALGFVVSPAGGRVAAAVPLSTAIGFQAFRVPVELMLWRLHAEGLVPAQMTFEGRNFDVVSGLLGLAIGLAWWGREVPRLVAAAYTAVGLGLLANVVTIALLSFPGPLRVFDATHTLPATAPWTVLPMVLVPFALAGHALVARRLLAGWSSGRSRASAGGRAPG